MSQTKIDYLEDHLRYEILMARFAFRELANVNPDGATASRPHLH